MGRESRRVPKLTTMLENKEFVIVNRRILRTARVGHLIPFPLFIAIFPARILRIKEPF